MSKRGVLVSVAVFVVSGSAATVIAQVECPDSYEELAAAGERPRGAPAGARLPGVGPVSASTDRGGRMQRPATERAVGPGDRRFGHLLLT